MSVQIPESARDLLERPIIAVLVTVMPDGQPQVTPVWFDYDGHNLRVNTAEGRQKARNMSQNSKVTVLLLDPQNPYHWLEWRGHVAETHDETHGGRDHINTLSARYTGNPVFQGRGGSNERRIQYIIAPDRINAQ